MYRSVYINGWPVNRWPAKNNLHLQDMADVEDVEYEDLYESVNNSNNEEVERDN